MVNYAYFIYSNVALFIWLVLFLYRRDVRKEMLFVSILTGLGGLFADALVYTKDWWKPEYVLGSVIGLEDIIFGFAIGGISAVIYEEIFMKRHYKDRKIIPSNLLELVFVLSFSITFVITFWFLNLHSFISNIIAYSIAIAIIYATRKDLILYSLLSGSLLVLVSMPLFWITLVFYPTWVQDTWLLHNLFGKLILGIPLEDLVWFYFTGLFIGPLYEFWYGYRTAKRKG